MTFPVEESRWYRRIMKTGQFYRFPGGTINLDYIRCRVDTYYIRGVFDQFGVRRKPRTDRIQRGAHAIHLNTKRIPTH